MNYRSSSKKALAIAVSLVALGGVQNTMAQDDEEAIEEIVVTGSHIKNGNENQSVPVDVFDRSEFEDQGSPSIEEIVQNMSAISATVNLTDEEPALAPYEIAYDAFSHSPIGRVLKLSYKYSM